MFTHGGEPATERNTQPKDWKVARNAQHSTRNVSWGQSNVFPARDKSGILVLGRTLARSFVRSLIRSFVDSLLSFCPVTSRSIISTPHHVVRDKIADVVVCQCSQ